MWSLGLLGLLLAFFPGLQWFSFGLNLIALGIAYVGIHCCKDINDLKALKVSDHAKRLSDSSLIYDEPENDKTKLQKERNQWQCEHHFRYYRFSFFFYILVVLLFSVNILHFFQQLFAGDAVGAFMYFFNSLIDSSLVWSSLTLHGTGELTQFHFPYFAHLILHCGFIFYWSNGLCKAMLKQ
jgi:hypothetical protein